MKYNPNIDALRAVAIIAVIAHHYQILPCGWIGVQFFFVLSGFLISGIVIQARETVIEGGTYTFFQRFYKRRILRLFPLYYGYLIALTLLYLVFKKPQAFGQEYIGLFTYVINFSWLNKTYIFHPYYGHLWSLAVEWQFYLIWPFILWNIPPKKLKKTLLWLLPAAMILRVLGCLYYTHQPWSISYHGNVDDRALAAYVLPFSHLDAFVFGALICNQNVRKFLAKPVVVVSCIGITALAGIILIVTLRGQYSWSTFGWPTRMPLGYQWIWGYSLLNLSSAVIVAAVLENSTAVFAFTRLRILQYTGKISYGMYVYHQVVVIAVLSARERLPNFFGRDAIGFVVILAVTMLISHLSYIYFEQWFIKARPTAAVKTAIKHNTFREATMPGTKQLN